MTSEDSKSSATMEPEEGDLQGLADKATRNARTLAEEGKQNTARQIGSVASAIRGAARELEGQMPQGAELVRSAAATLESGADQLRSRSVDDWFASLRKFAHDEPAALFGGAILAGFALSRFFNSSRARSGAGDQRS